MFGSRLLSLICWTFLIIGIVTVAAIGFGYSSGRIKCEDILTAPITICTIDRR